MSKLELFLQENLPGLQECVEEKLNVQLGEIKIKSLHYCMADFCDEENINKKDYPLWLICGYVFFNFMEWSSLGKSKAGRSSIYYSRNPLAFIGNSQSELTFTSLHELTHVAHRRIFDASPESSSKNSFYNIPSDIMEGFADYVALDILKDLKLPQVRLTHGRWGAISDFKNMMVENDIQDYNGLKKYVIPPFRI